jgi:hypothetical protein
MTLKYYNEGAPAYRTMDFSDVRTYVIGPEEQNSSETNTVSKLQALPDSLKKPKLYLGFGLGAPMNVSGYLTFITKSDWGGSVRIRSISWDRRDQARKGQSLMGGPVIPGDEIIELSFLVVREFNIQDARRVRAGVEFGPAYVIYDKVENTELNACIFWGYYYSASYTTYKIPGLSLRTKLEFPVSQGFGIELALFGNINAKKPYGGIEFQFMIGKVRDRIKPKRNTF